MAEYVDPIGAGLSGLSEGFLKGATLATVLGQRRGSVRHQKELELQNALQMDDPGLQELRLKDLIDKGVVNETEAKPYLDRAHFQNRERMTLGNMMLLNPKGEELEGMIEESRKNLAAKGYGAPKFLDDFDKIAGTQRKREELEAKNESIGFLRLMGRANDPEAGDAVRKTAIGAIVGRMQKLGVSEEITGMLQKLKPDEMQALVASLSRQVLDEGLTMNQALQQLQGVPVEEAAGMIGDLIKQGRVLAAGQGYQPPQAAPEPQAGTFERDAAHGGGRSSRDMMTVQDPRLGPNEVAIPLLVPGNEHLGGTVEGHETDERGLPKPGGERAPGTSIKDVAKEDVDRAIEWAKAHPEVIRPAKDYSSATPSSEPFKPLPGVQRLRDVTRDVTQLKTDLRALETEGGKPAEVLAIRKELTKRTEDLRTLEEEHSATIAETASKPVQSYVGRLSALGGQIDSKQDQIRAIEEKGLDKTPGGQKRIEALNKQIDEHNKQMDKLADTGPITKDEHLVRALQEGGVQITDKRAIAKVMADKDLASTYLQRADAIKKIDEVKKAKVAEGEKVHSAKVEDARGGHLQLYKVDEKGKVTNLSKIPLGRDPINQTMTLLRARVAGLNTGVKEMDAIDPKKAEDLLVRLNRADPIKAALASMLEGAGGGTPKAEDILKKR
jgi:hypothetical protein